MFVESTEEERKKERKKEEEVAIRAVAYSKEQMVSTSDLMLV